MNSHSAFIPTSGSRLLDPLVRIARKNGFNVDRHGSKLVIDAPLGRVDLEPVSPGTRLTLSARTPAELQLLVDLYAQRIDDLQLGVSLRWETSDQEAPLNQIIGTVIGTLPLSPNFARLRLAGNFEAFARPDAGLHFRLLLHSENPGWPIRDENGLTRWPHGADSWHRPPYTVRKISENHDWIDVDIVLHEGGRVTEWCNQVGPGDEIALHGPSGSKQPKAQWLGLLGDETALPVIMRIIEDAPSDTKGKAVIAVRHPDDAQVAAGRSNFPITWVDMAKPDVLQRALRDLAPPVNNRHVFFAAERAQAAQARQTFQEMGLAAPDCKAAAYWSKTAT